jgi:hypothetical protein
MDFDLSEEGYKKALDYFNELINSRKYQYLKLVESRHPYSEGYWVEYNNESIHDSFYERIIFEYDGKADFRDARIDEILNDD